MLKLAIYFSFLGLFFAHFETTYASSRRKLNEANSSLYDTSPFSDKYCRRPSKTPFELRFHDYTIRISRDSFFSCSSLEIRKSGKLVFPKKDSDQAFEYLYLFGHREEIKYTYFLNLLGTDKTQIAVSAWIGGQVGPGILFIFDLGKEFRKIAELDTGDVESPRFLDLDGDGIPEIIIEDSPFDSAFGSFGGRSSGTVILKYQSGKYMMAENLMYKPAPTKASISRQIRKWQAEFRDPAETDFPPPDFVQALTQLIYTGHPDQARKFIDWVWPSDIDGKNEFIREYREDLSSSDYLSQASEKMR